MFFIIEPLLKADKGGISNDISVDKSTSNSVENGSIRASINPSARANFYFLFIFDKSSYYLCSKTGIITLHI